MPSVWIGFGRLFQADVCQEPSVCGTLASSCRHRREIICVVVLMAVSIVAVLMMHRPSYPVRVPDRPDGSSSSAAMKQSLQRGELTVALSSSETRTVRRRFTKNCTMKSATTGVEESVELLPAASVGGSGGALFAKIIHRLWKTKDVPATWTEGASSCRLVNPDHSYCHWTDAELDAFIGAEYPWFLDTYRSYTYDIQRVDAARYFVLFHYGGTYLDLDLVCRRPLTNILNAGTTSAAVEHVEAIGDPTAGDISVVISSAADDDDIVLVETLPVGVTNEFMAVRRARDPFMRDVVMGLQPNADLWYVFSYPTIMFSTGPMYLSNRLWHMQAVAANRSVTATAAVTTNVRIIERRQFLSEYFKHLVGSSWHRWDGKIIWLFFRLRYYLLVTAIVLILLAAFFIVTHMRRRRLVKR